MDDKKREDKLKEPLHVRETPMTYEDYAALPDDGLQYELVDGRLELMSPAPTARHQLVSGIIERLMEQTCGREYIFLHAPIDVILSNKEVRQPDLLAIHRNRLHIITKRGIEGPPDLVVEVLSPSTLKRDKIGKRTSYARVGVPEYWIVQPQNGELEQYVLQEDRYELKDVYLGDDTVQSNVLKCVSFTMNDVMSAVPDIP